MLPFREIERLAKAHHKENPTSSPEALKRFLEFWWCRHYNRPFKDPLLQQYTGHELLYEFLRIHFLTNDPDAEMAKQEAVADDEQWIQEQREQMKKQSKAEENQPVPELPEIKASFEDKT